MATVIDHNHCCGEIKFERRRRDVCSKYADESVYATENIKAGELIYDWKSSLIPSNRDRHTLQIGIGKHVLFKDIDFRFCNHSCQPNCRHDLDEEGSYAINDISKGQELTFFFPSTEWEMVCPFYCECNEKNCIDFVGGAKFLPVDKEWMSILTDHCQKFMNAHIKQRKEIKTWTEERIQWR